MITDKNKFLRWTIYICLSIIPFLAFYVSGFGFGVEWNAMLFPYITGKNFAFRILVEIAAAAWIMLMILDKSFRPKKSIILWMYSIFLFVLLLADIFSIDRAHSFFSNFERMEGFIGHAHLFLYFLILISFFKDKASWAKHRFVLFLSNIPVLFLAFLQLLGLESFTPMKLLPSLRNAIHEVFAPTQGGNQLDSSLGNSTYLAIYSIFFIFLFFIAYLENKSEKAKNNWTYLLMIVLNLIVLFYTQTRGAQIGFAIGIFVSAVIIYFGGRKFKELKNKRKISLAIIIITLVAYFSLLVFGQTSFIQNSSTLNKLAKVSKFSNPVTLVSKFKDINKELYNPSSTYESLLSISNDGTFTSRLINIKMVLEGLKERPILGWGQDNYFYVFSKYNDARMYAQEPWFDRAHNVFMDWLVAGGVIGLLAYLSLYFAGIYMLWSKKAKTLYNSHKDFTERAILTGLLISYFIHNIFVFDNLISYILFIIVLAYISIRFGDNKNKENDKSINESKSKIIIYAPFVIIALLASLYYLNVRYILANKYILNGIIQKTYKDMTPLESINKNLGLFEKAVSIGGIAKLESREQLAQTTLSVVNQIQSANIPQTEQYMPIYKVVSDYISMTKSSYESLFNEKMDPRSLSIYSSFLKNIGDNQSALKYGEMAHNMAPMKQTIALEYIDSLIENMDYKKANDIAEKMYISDTSYVKAKNIYAMTNLYIGNFDKGEQLLIDENGVIALDQNSITIYKNQNKLDRLISILKNNIKANPEDTNSIILLSSVYMEKGNNYLAISLLRDLAKIKPEYSSQIENYIKTIK